MRRLISLLIDVGLLVVSLDAGRDDLRTVALLLVALGCVVGIFVIVIVAIALAAQRTPPYEI